MANVLVVDDDEPTCRTLMRLVRMAGHAADCVLEALKALDVVRTTAPDLVILDVNMPGMSGIELLERIKSDPATAAIPVVMFSAANDATAEREARARGAIDFWLKASIHFKEIETRINAFVGGQRAN